MQGVDFYNENADSLMLEQFVIEHRPLVKKIALYIKRRLPSYISLDDLLQSGFIGLLEARKQYKTNMGASFETYASIRIRGSILDSLRKNSWSTREASKYMRQMGEAITRIEQRGQKQPTSEEIAAELGITVEEHDRICQQISICNVVSLDAVEDIGDEDLNPFEITHSADLKYKVKDILAHLPERDQLVLSLYYVEEFTFKQIGDILDLTEARICQLHSQAIAKIQNKMRLNNSNVQRKV